MDGCEMHRVLVVSGYCGANHMATPELAAHGIADDLAATAHSGYRGILCEQLEQPGANETIAGKTATRSAKDKPARPYRKLNLMGGP